MLNPIFLEKAVFDAVAKQRQGSNRNSNKYKTPTKMKEAHGAFNAHEDCGSMNACRLT